MILKRHILVKPSSDKSKVVHDTVYCMKCAVDNFMCVYREYVLSCCTLVYPTSPVTHIKHKSIMRCIDIHILYGQILHLHITHFSTNYNQYCTLFFEHIYIHTLTYIIYVPS